MLGRLFGSSTAASVSVQEARERQQAGALIVDVREADEWAGGHVPGARHVPLSRFNETARALPKDTELLVICRSGNRSARATTALREAGFNAVNVSGGMIAWQRHALPIKR